MHTDSKIQIIKLLDIMMWANGVGRDGYAGHDSVYGKCQDAIIEIVKTEEGVDIRNCNWNLGGNSTYLQDLEICIENEKKRLARTIFWRCTENREIVAYFANKPEDTGLGYTVREAVGDLLYNNYKVTKEPI